MRFQTPLVPGTLIRRYKRFLADVKLDDGREVVAHCANTGAMTGFKTPGLRVWLEPNDDPKKKLKYGWRLCEMPDGCWSGIDTSVPNRVVKEALKDHKIKELAGYHSVRAEVAYGKSSRIDFLLTGPDELLTYVEVKNVHLSRAPGLAEFPDAKTARGVKHLEELSEMVAQGHRAFMLYLVQRTGCSRFALAHDIDKAYSKAFRAALKAGVEMLCYDSVIDTSGVWLGNRLEIVI